MPLKLSVQPGFVPPAGPLSPARVTQKARLAMQMFGLTLDRLGIAAPSYHCELDLLDGDIIYITGPSGAGKSVLLRQFQNAVPPGQKADLARIPVPKNKTVIDCIDAGLVESLRLLGAAGLNDVPCLLGRPANLSDGQKWRFRLAVALAAGKKFLFADEFCSNLDRITAAVIACSIRKLAARAATIFFLASCREDILADLQPDVLIVKRFGDDCEVLYRDAARRRQNRRK